MASTQEVPPRIELDLSGTGTKPLVAWLEAYMLLLLLIAVVIFFSVWANTSDTFATAANLRVLVGGQAVVAVVALAALIPLTTNEWDLSVGAVAGLSAVFAASVLSNGTAIPVAILLSTGIGATVGLVNALLITRVGTNAVITTLGTATIVDGVVTQKTGGQALVSDIPVSLTDFGSGNWLGVPRTAFVLLTIALTLFYVLNYTPLGRYAYAMGSNRRAAKLVGIRTKLVLASAFIGAGALSGSAGVLQVAYAGGADPKVGDAFTLPALAAAFLSAAAIKPGRYNVAGTMVAIFFLATLNNGLTLAGAQPQVNQYVNGAALIIGVGLGSYLRRRGGGDSQ